ncbi:elongin C [Paramarasmius palmivorus]|uniref:Elongin-C n=1 Tax=Paramarasmius palmivorus TaxID=297713 RepID=A0AAW0EFI0_9AGAR
MNEDVQMGNAAEASGEDWVRIVSNDGFSFLVKRKIAQMSGTIASSLDMSSGYSESETKTYNASNDRGIIVQKLLEYMCFKAHYSNTKRKVPLNEFMDRIPPEIVLELLLAADYHEM